MFPSNLDKVLQIHENYSSKFKKIFSTFHTKTSHQFFSQFFFPNNLPTDSCCSQHVMGQRSTCGGSGHSSPRKSIYMDAVDRYRCQIIRYDGDQFYHFESKFDRRILMGNSDVKVYIFYFNLIF